jgi:uncharacterized peroxidase-related enzyme
MAHIALPDGLPGIAGPMNAYPETGVHLRGLANALLRGPSSLTPGERELIATSVSAGNQCVFCTRSHAAVAQQHLQAGRAAVEAALAGGECELVTPKLRALLALAELVRRDGRAATPEAVAQARAAGADDQAIHDTVLIAAAFCMFNRYVDGLATITPQDDASYDQMGARLASSGY